MPAFTAPIPVPLLLVRLPLSALTVVIALGGAAAHATAATGAAPTGEPWKCHVIDNTSRGSDGTKLADLNRDRLPDITTGWEEGNVTRIYLNPGPAAAKSPWPAATVGVTPSVEDAVFADLDGDGALDVISSAEGQTQRVYVHWAPSSAARLLEPGAWKQEVFPALDKLTRWMFAEPLQIDGRGGVDLVIGGKAGEPQRTRSVLGWLQSPPNPRDLAAWQWHPLVEVGWTMSIVTEDMDGDGDADLLISDRHGATRGVFWLENPGPARSTTAANWRRHDIGATAAREIMFLGLGDVDGDGLRDLAVAVRVGEGGRREPNDGSQVRWFRRLDPTGKRWAESVIAAPAATGSVKAVAIGDLDGDRRADLVVSCEQARDGRIGVYALQQYGDRAAPGWKPINIAGPRGIKYDLVHLLDLDGDGDLDVLTNDEQEGGGGLGIVWYENPLGRRNPAR